VSSDWVEEMDRLREEAQQATFLAEKLEGMRDDDREHLKYLCLESGLDPRKVEVGPEPGVQELADLLVEHYERLLTEKDNHYIEVLYNRMTKELEDDAFSEVSGLWLTAEDDGGYRIWEPTGPGVLRTFYPEGTDSWHEFEHGGRVWDGHFTDEGRPQFEVFETFLNDHGERYTDAGRSVILEVRAEDGP
jgi:hypothetical protein